VTQRIETLQTVASSYDAIVFDQWGVLHNGSTPYPGAIDCLRHLAHSGLRLAVLSNSGKRAAPNADRIAAMGFEHSLFEFVMTSGEALYTDVSAGLLSERRLYPIERSPGDAGLWANGLDLELTDSLDEAEAILLMGLPDGSELESFQGVLSDAFERELPMFCTNPDRSSPRSGGLVVSPGALAFAYADMGGRVRFYGKPHRPVFSALETVLGTDRLLMIGDSLEHDIAGAQRAGWDSLLIEGGLYADDFATGDGAATLARLVSDKGCHPPTYRMETLK
jgi:HAD superfamily hydrolase (TIGR01459 family)